MDKIKEKFIKAIDTAKKRGMVNTANGLSNFIDNCGKQLNIDADSFLDGIKPFKQEFETAIEEAKIHANNLLQKKDSGKELDLAVSGNTKNFNFNRSDNLDLFNVLNDFNYSYEARLISFKSSDIPSVLKNYINNSEMIDKIKNNNNDNLAFMSINLNIKGKFNLIKSIDLGPISIGKDDFAEFISNNSGKGFNIEGKSSNSFLVWEYKDQTIDNTEEEDNLKEKLSEKEVVGKKINMENKGKNINNKGPKETLETKI